jgi:hypothetical protein
MSDESEDILQCHQCPEDQGTWKCYSVGVCLGRNVVEVCTWYGAQGLGNEG